ncbi:glutaredoxin-like protein NrdH [Subtercola frigoramans]|uniref:Glutaredoxin-like protein NrdH n=1 Tax=Subtercola frigoramans TaxID=120298 RepID=A0ABS2L0E4_9MICO|nr:glutaredoxin-like protein NrdH [Subtercola frigoramans]MBM7470534.1 glutaredoxin-like protein NrdH [Subtercola frigoramans]
MTTVTLFSKPGCVQCTATKRALTDRSIDAEIIDITQDPAALEHVKGLGYLQVPVVETPTTTWVGFRPDLIATLVL